MSELALILAKYGINIYDSNGERKDICKLVEEIAPIWDILVI